MSISVFELFNIGVGPSSSHTVGPMRAAHRFVDELCQFAPLDDVVRVEIYLHGSLAATGAGHATDRATLMGLMGKSPESINPQLIEPFIEEIIESQTLRLGDKHIISFVWERDLHWDMEPLPFHPNAMTLSACYRHRRQYSATYYSIGGGFILTTDEVNQQEDNLALKSLPIPFTTARQLLDQCRQNHMSIAEVMMRNECSWRTEREVRSSLLSIWKVMQSCIESGLQQEGILPGGLNVKRRAPELFRRLNDPARHNLITTTFTGMEWVNLFALAVNEENAAGGRMVTAPTNGAAGIIPAVLNYYIKFQGNTDDNAIVDFLLTAGAVGILCKLNASISGAEVGCQGEVGVACAMAAAGLAQILGGSPEQVENAAEIGLEHNLGLTCDPIGGLVQIPCIERNAIASVKAINAAQFALGGDGEHHVSLDRVIRTMRETGHDMQSKYKETSQGGLAVSMIEC
ncbi:L-serine dehydratase 1 [Halomonadaceae bacterium LMG 33818]|uniref:L-serine ammonia-lyase n=1 Tax=Cernens ardua TaxID=3402176 RepID=UPI003EDBAA93